MVPVVKNKDTAALQEAAGSCAQEARCVEAAAGRSVQPPGQFGGQGKVKSWAGQGWTTAYSLSAANPQAQNRLTGMAPAAVETCAYMAVILVGNLVTPKPLTHVDIQLARVPGWAHTALSLCMLQVSELEAMRKREEGNLKALQKEHQQLKKDQFKAAQALHSLRQVRHCASTAGATSR